MSDPICTACAERPGVELDPRSCLPDAPPAPNEAGELEAKTCAVCGWMTVAGLLAIAWFPLPTYRPAPELVLLDPPQPPPRRRYPRFRHKWRTLHEPGYSCRCELCGMKICVANYKVVAYERIDGERVGAYPTPSCVPTAEPAAP